MYETTTRQGVGRKAADLGLKIGKVCVAKGKGVCVNNSDIAVYVH